MYRLSRPAGFLACAFLLGATAANAADPVLDSQRLVGTANRGDTEASLSDFDASSPAIATVPERLIALVVWSADDASAPAGDENDSLRVVDEEFEIFGRLVNTNTLGDESSIGRLSVMGDDFESDKESRQRFDAHNPAVAWNPVAEEFLLVWEGDDDTAPLVDDEFEIFGQRLDINGRFVGERFRISTMGNDAATSPADRQAYGAHHPVVTVNTLTGEYLVGWQGETDSGTLVDGEVEVFGRLFSAEGVAKGEQFRISFAGDDGNTAVDATLPAVVFNPVSERFYVAWQSDDSTAGLSDDESEIFIQALAEDGTPDSAPLQVSAMGPAGDANFDAHAPALAVNPATGSLLVAWHGDSSEGSLVEGEQEIFARLLDTNPAPLGSQFRVSVMGPDDDAAAASRVLYAATRAAAEWSENDQRFLVAWDGDTKMAIEVAADGDTTETRSLVNDEHEVFGRYVTASGTLPASQFRISVQGGDLQEDAEVREKYDAAAPVIEYTNGVLVTAWSGDTDTPGSSDGWMQIFATRVARVSTELEIGRDSFVQPTIPEPIRLPLTLTNNGSITARNVAVQLSMTTAFPYSFAGCEAVVNGNTCELGDIEANGTAAFTIILETDHLVMGDELGTTLKLATRSDTALTAIEKSSGDIFVGAKLEIEGGSGATGGFWLLLAGLAPLAGARRRRNA